MPNSDQLCLLSTPPPPGRAVEVDVTGRAATALGWGGVVAPGMTLFGQRVGVVAEVDQLAHARRVESGWGPVTDRMSVALWGWSENQVEVPPSAVRLRGVIACGTRWQRALAAAGGFVGFCSTAIVVEQATFPNEHCLVTAHLYGVSVLRMVPSDGVPAVVQVGRDGPVDTARPSLLSRWVEEMVYARLVDIGGLTVARAG